MTKRDYIAIAKVINDLEVRPGTLISKCDLVMELAELFKQDNPHFDQGKFADACQEKDWGW